MERWRDGERERDRDTLIEKYRERKKTKGRLTHREG